MRRARVLLLIALAAPAHVAATPSSLVLSPPGPQREARARLELDRRGIAAIAGATAVAWALSAGANPDLQLRACRWCEPGAVDERMRSALRWGDPSAAAKISDQLRRAVPLGSAAAVAWLAMREGGRWEAVEDVLAVGAAMALTGQLTATVKDRTARLRPDAWAAGRDQAANSFFSAHTSRVFAAAAAAAQVARLRGRPGWKWLAGAAFAAAAGTAYLRVAADQHWATDVLAAAATGTAVGFAVPALVLRRTHARRGVSLAPSPGGIVLVF